MIGRSFLSAQEAEPFLMLRSGHTTRFQSRHPVVQVGGFKEARPGRDISHPARTQNWTCRASFRAG